MNILKRIKIKRALKNFQEFKKHYKFEYKILEKIEDESLFCEGVLLKDNNDQHMAVENDKIINAGYNCKGEQLAKVLSNLFPYKFEFRGFKVSSIEGVLQGLKFRDKKAQKLVFDYSGLNSNRIRACADYDWRENQVVYFQGKSIKRESEEYQNFIDELYVSLLQNRLFVNALKAVQSRYIVHSMGNEDKTQTLLSRYEFEFELNCLKDYVLTKQGIM